jgi:hypothetical protein
VKSWAGRNYIHLYYRDRDGLLALRDRIRSGAFTIVTAIESAG